LVLVYNFHQTQKQGFVWVASPEDMDFFLNVRVDKEIEAPQKAEQEDRNDTDSNIESQTESSWGLQENDTNVPCLVS